MALVFIDGFDHYAIADLGKKWTSVATEAGSTLSMDAGRVYGQSLKALRATNGKSSSIVKSITSAYKGIVGFALYMTAYTTLTNGQQRASMAITTLHVAGASNTFLLVQSDGTLAVYNNDGIYGFIFGGIFLIAGGSIPLNTWTYLELTWDYTLSGGTHASWAIRVNGIEEAAGEFISTRAPVSAVQVLGSSTSSYYYNGSIWIDDLYILGGTTGQVDPYGDVQIQARMPTADGTNHGGTPSTGSDNFAMVDETLADVSDYVTFPTVGLVDTYATEQVDPGTSIAAIQVSTLSNKDEEGSCAVVASIYHDAAVHDHIQPSGVSITSKFNTFVFETDPDGDAWTDDSFNACEFGVKKVV